MQEKGNGSCAERPIEQGSIVVYSGKPGETVPDGPKGGNSPFVTAWSKEIQRAAGKSVMDVVDLGDFYQRKICIGWLQIMMEVRSLFCPARPFWPTILR